MYFPFMFATRPPLEEPLVIAAKHFGRSVDSWTSFTDILKVGLRNAVKGDCPEEYAYLSNDRLSIR
jgi:hypothetical protein